jgi:hypothetical protein
MADEGVQITNLSFVAPGPANASSDMSLGIDWFSAANNMLFVHGRGNAATAPDVIPGDSYNVLNVGATSPVMVNGQNVFTRVTAGEGGVNDTTNATDGRYLTEIVAPGDQILSSVINRTDFVAWRGTSFAAPHVTGAAALLMQYANARIAANAPRWDSQSRQHQLIKAVLMNSADKILDNGNGDRVGMSKTIERPDGSSWLNSDARDDPNNVDENGRQIGRYLPYDTFIGAGQLNVRRAITQYASGNVSPPAPGAGGVPDIGWNVGVSGAGANGENITKYPFLHRLKGGSYVSLTLTWDRIVTDSNSNGRYDSGERLTSSPLADLNLYLLPRGSNNINQAVWSSISGLDGTVAYNLEHIFFQLPNDGDYEFWVVNNSPTGSSSTAYAVAWWSASQANHPPQANADDATTRQGQPVALNVLDNDVDPDGDPLTVVAVNGSAEAVGQTVTLASGAQVSVGSDGSVNYTPPSGFVGTDSFEYTISDGAETASATVTITVTENHRPVAAADGYSVEMNGTLTVASPGVLGNDTDEDGDPLEAELADSPAHGSLDFSTDGSFTYTPATDYVGPDSFTYSPWDGYNGGDPVTVSITVTGPVNHPPVAAGDGYTTGKNQPLYVSDPGLLGNDTDEDGDSLTVVQGDFPAHGWVSLGPTGAFSYTPDQGYVGDDSFTYQAYDGQGYSSAVTVTIHVTGDGNRAPLASDDGYTTPRDVPLSVSAPGVLGNDSDPDDDPLTATLFSGTSHGALTFNADGSFTYTPDAGYVGDDSFVYAASDGSLFSSDVTVTITVQDPNRLVATDDSYTVAAGQMLSVPAAGVLANDMQPGGGIPDRAWLVGGASHGSVTFNTDGSFTYTPDAGFVGDDSFTYEAGLGMTAMTSNLATVAIRVTDGDGQNHPPVLTAPGDQTAGEGSLVRFSVMASDPDGDALTYSLVGPPAGASINAQTGAFSFTPDDGPATFTNTIKVADPAGLSDTKSFILTVLNVAPTADRLDVSNQTPVIGQSVTFTLVNPRDPSSADTAAGFRVAYHADFNGDGDFDDAGEDWTWADGPSFDLAFANYGPHAVHVRLFDKDDGYSDFWSSVYASVP